MEERLDAAEYPGVPDGTAFRETAYLRSGIVDSVDERFRALSSRR